GLFVKEIETSLLEKQTDLAVHSMKDMPAEIPQGLCIGVVPERENPLDVLIARNGHSFENLPEGARLGSSSLRRGAQVRHIRPDITIHPLRGNLDTRIRKLETEGLDDPHTKTRNRRLGRHCSGSSRCQKAWIGRSHHRIYPREHYAPCHRTGGTRYRNERR
ncbi:MAG: hypothetical protein JRE24_11480, partial [Deltaproteobacteria bacterium]|nr:hypothetical protein [Deltaproteobacteria bacterium]